MKTVEHPLFPGYLSSRFEQTQSPAVRQTAGVVDVVGFAGQLAPIDDTEVEAVRVMLASGRASSRGRMWRAEIACESIMARSPEFTARSSAGRAKFVSC